MVIEAGPFKGTYPLDTVFKTKVLSDTTFQIFWRDFREVRLTFPEETSKKIGYTSLMTALEKKICTQPRVPKLEFPHNAVTDVDKMFVKEEWLRGDKAQWKKSTFDIIIPKEIPEKVWLTVLNHLRTSNYVSYPCSILLDMCHFLAGT